MPDVLLTLKSSPAPVAIYCNPAWLTTRDEGNQIAGPLNAIFQFGGFPDTPVCFWCGVFSMDCTAAHCNVVPAWVHAPLGAQAYACWRAPLGGSRRKEARRPVKQRNTRTEVSSCGELPQVASDFARPALSGLRRTMHPMPAVGGEIPSCSSRISPIQDTPCTKTSFRGECCPPVHR